ncbi:glycosyl transferase family 2 [Hymenobacter roseosalivarius DSM 11622]|uniref:Glycosyl transferase family 2 n=1 Tax=Hymenobacter roseosalivarius DSM 11622 TaxID=645990 RepID=A0A1W1W515_9BACT|nr:glycosyltransferase family A protein [Hymenobacter roseosalivarius]SMC00623.1 glycosyl transferase family 2 [Hymenobacter roseosalivarius DSM 11622]
MTTFSFIIPTYNRVAFIKQTIESILQCCKNKTNYEILIIDNNSTDNTAHVVRPLLENPLVRYILETRQGVAHARNRGIIEAKNDILIYLDDDIDLDAHYFEVCNIVFTDPSKDIVGGKVLPFNTEVPEWLPKKYHYLVSVLDLGNEPENTSMLMGANYALRKTLAERIGWYNTELGRKGTSLMAGEENDYFNRSKALGYPLFYEPKLIVYHKIDNKLNKVYVYNHAKMNGKAEGILDYKYAKLKFSYKIAKSVFMIALYYIYGSYAIGIRERTWFKINQLYSLGYLSVAKDKLFI